MSQHITTERSEAVGSEPTTRMIDIGGRRLTLTCMGQGTSAVVLETGLGAESGE